MPKIICAWCDPRGAQDPDVTSTICPAHKAEQLRLVEELKKAKERKNETPRQ